MTKLPGTFEAQVSALGTSSANLTARGEGAFAVPVALACRTCKSALTLEEMHYCSNADGTATCKQCESNWMVAVDSWSAGHGDEEFPQP